MNNKCIKVKWLFLLFLPIVSLSQISYQPVTNKNVSFGSYGRVGVDWSFVNGGSIGRRLNLNNMGSIGGRLEEQDYVELAPAIHFKPFKENDPTEVNVQFRFSIYSRSLSLLGNSSTSSLGGLTLAMPEIFAEARNINGSGINVWVGSRLYRGPDVHIADHFYFNDHSGQGFGIEWMKTRFCAIFVSSTDTSSNLPPYFYLNFQTGTPGLALRQRVVFSLEHDIVFSEKGTLTLLGEFHRMGDADSPVEISPYEADSTVILNYPSDFGYVFGMQYVSQLGEINSGQYNRVALRYGARIANGGDGGISKTSFTFGAPNLESMNFKGAYSVSLVDEIFLNLAENNALNGYLIYTNSKGGAKSNGLSETYFGREVYNRKQDFTIGFRDTHFFADKFHLISEIHYSTRKDGTDDPYAMTKFSIAPVFVPTGQKSAWARPQLRFVTSVAHYNDAAKNGLYSPYLSFTGPKQWGYYFGVKAEWWLWE